jgi:hypothetical protein
MAFPAGTAGARLAHPDPMFDRSHSSAHRGELEYSAEVAPGVIMTWDPALPYQCADFVITQKIDRVPWLRLAAVTVLDQLLYLPLDRSLLDAEIAAAQLGAARTLAADEPVREFLIGRALVGARRASPGVVAYLERLAVDDRRPPAALGVPLGVLARCYAVLSGEVREFDVELAAVSEAWHRLASIKRAAIRGRRVFAPPPLAEPSRPGAAQIDPRSVPARVVRLGPTSDAAEISVDLVAKGRCPALRVRVAAFANKPSSDEAADLGVRLIDRRSGQIRGYGLLGQPAVRQAPSLDAPERFFEGIVSLPDSVSAPDVRVDLYGVASTAPPIAADRAELRRVRRATLFLSEWRVLVADVRLWGMRAAPTARLRTIVRRIADDNDSADGPLWSGGPSRSYLTGLADVGDRALTTLLRQGKAPARGRDDGEEAGLLEAVAGPGDLLAAEAAARYAVIGE